MKLLKKLEDAVVIIISQSNQFLFLATFGLQSVVTQALSPLEAKKNCDNKSSSYVQKVSWLYEDNDGDNFWVKVKALSKKGHFENLKCLSLTDAFVKSHGTSTNQQRKKHRKRA